MHFVHCWRSWHVVGLVLGAKPKPKGVCSGLRWYNLNNDNETMMVSNMRINILYEVAGGFRGMSESLPQESEIDGCTRDD